MKLPIRNFLSTPLTLFIEPLCDEYEVPPGGEAIVTLEDGKPHSFDYYAENWLTIWDEGRNKFATVEVFADRPSPALPKHKPVEKLG